VSANLLLHPILDITKDQAGAVDPKIIHLASQDWIDQVYDPIHLLRSVATKNLLEFAKQGRAFESFRVDVIEEFGKVVWVAPQLGGQVIGELDGPLGMAILHHHHAVPAPKGPVYLFALLDKALVTGDQVVAAGANGQVRHGIINRRHGQDHGYCQ